MKRIPIYKAHMLDDLEDAELLAGYCDGYDGEPEPGNNRSYSYWHGWRNGSTDAGFREKDAAQAALARDVIQTHYFKRKLS